MKIQFTALQGSIALIIFILFFVFLTAFLLFIPKDVPQTLTQSWVEYHSVNDWDISRHAITDIDGDGMKDMITLPNYPNQPTHYCVFLSSFVPDDIPENQRCERPGMTHIVAPNTHWVGQTLEPKFPPISRWLKKSYLVKTQQDRWRFYDISGLHVRVFEKNTQGIFKETSPTLLDRIDVLTYQFSHLGVVILLYIFLLIYGY